MREYKICKRCVMDTTANEITFNQNDFCNFCSDFQERLFHVQKNSQQFNESKLKKLIQEIKTAGKNKKYDCVVGVSGGIDSSWVLVKVKELGLRPLPVHMDNGWNSELAQNNIENLVKGLGFDLFTHVIDWEEYRGFMKGFLDSDVIDLELLMDNAMIAVNYQQAQKYGIKYILAGTNQSTEGMSMPNGWNWFKFDKQQIKFIGKKFSSQKMKSFPGIGTIDLIKFSHLKKIKWISILDFLDYKKDIALKNLENSFNYKPYPYKHYESILTRFYQGHLLPEKFGIDKRKLHFSTLIITGQMSREQAIIELQKSPYGNEVSLLEDKDYFIKKMKWTNQEFDNYLSRPEKKHSELPSEKWLWDLIFSDGENRYIYKKLKYIYKLLINKKYAGLMR